MTLPILVIEHDDLARETIVQMLSEMEYDALGVQVASHAFRILEIKQYAVVIVTLGFNDPNGSEVAIEAKVRQPYTKVVVVSGAPVPERLSTFVDAFLRKPFTLRDLQRTIRVVTAGVNSKPRIF